MFGSRHLACVLLLLSSIGAAQGQTRPSSEFGFGGHYIGALLYRNATPLRVEHAPYDLLKRSNSEELTAALPARALATYRATWTMHAATAQTASVHAFTGLAPQSSGS